MRALNSAAEKVAMARDSRVHKFRACVANPARYAPPMRSLTLFSLLVFASSSLRALDPNRLISQYGHRAWRNEEGFLDRPSWMTQTTDGYMWICTVTSLMRFDGAKFTPWISPAGVDRPRGVTSLLGARDGSLWIATSHGLMHLIGDKLVDYTSRLAGAGINNMIEDHTGVVWFTRYRITDGKGPLCRILGRNIRCYGADDGIPVKYGLGLTEDAAGNIWMGSNVLCRWKPGSSSVYLEEESKHAGDGVNFVAVGPSGSVWAAMDGVGPKLGVRYYANKKWVPYVVPGFDGTRIRATALLMDRKQSLWIGTESEGLYRIHNGAADHYGTADGLSGNEVGSLYEDREGNLWVVTNKGVDFFRETPVVTFSTSTGLVGTNIEAVLASTKGFVWVGTQGGLNSIHQTGKISALATGSGLPGQQVQTLFEDRAGRTWLGMEPRIMTYEHGHFLDIENLDGSPLGDVGMAEAFTEDTDGNIWCVLSKKSQFERQLLRIKGRRVREVIPLNQFFPRARFLVADRIRGIWVGSDLGQLGFYQDHKMGIIPLSGRAKPLAMYSIYVGSDNALWAATNKGLYHWKNGQLNAMDSRNGLPCSVIYSAIHDNYGSLWVYAQCGLLQIGSPELEKWLKDPKSQIRVKTFDQFDGVQAGPGASSQPTVSKSPDGQLWFATDMVVQTIDPSRSYTDVNPPPVYVEDLSANHRRYGAHGKLRLPPLQRELEINYTAVNFTVPQKVRFRYKLEGHDTEWQNAGTRRQAFYNDLAPGKYEFHVIACNKDGLWNNKGATLAFSIAPAWYQTIWFRVSCLGAFGLLLWLVYQLRRRRLQHEFDMGLEARVNERMRIARELHDTLLQNLAGVSLQLDGISKQLTSTPQSGASMIRHVREQVDACFREARLKVWNLRSASVEGQGLPAALGQFVNRIRPATTARCELNIAGRPRPFPPEIEEELLRIAEEATNNAIRHAQPNEIQIVVEYGVRSLRLQIKDDGRGFDLDEGLRKSGHFGLKSMRERAAQIRAKYSMRSAVGCGTQIEVVVQLSRWFARRAGVSQSN